MKKILKKETVLKGLPLSRGIAVAHVCRFNHDRHSNLPVYKVHGDGVEHEISRVERAAQIAIERIEIVRQEARIKIGPAEAEIFTAQQMILKDPALLKRAAGIIRAENTNAEAAVMIVMDAYEKRIRDIDDEYIRDRASDIGEIKRRMLDVLANMSPQFQCTSEGHCQRGKNRIVITDELTPGMTMELDTSSTMGFVTERGGANSHAAILARALGIPSVSGIKDIHSSIACGTEVLVNGNNGEVIVWPSEQTIARIRAEQGPDFRAIGVVDPVAELRTMANISIASEVGEAVAMKAEGIGLYRTEFEFIAAGRFLEEDEQYERYAAVVKAMNGLPVTFRLFDAGGDKPLPFLDIPVEDNPALGWRGSRLLLGQSVLMKTQARALARASLHGPVHVLYPMIIDLDQFVRLRDIFNEAISGIRTGEIKHGVMFEVPSACLQADDIMKAADFASIGTNDLIQYLFAVDRNNDLVAYDYSPDRPVLWTVIAMLAKAAERSGKHLSVCGELAGDPKYVLKFMNLGIRTVSVSARLIPGIRVVASGR